MIEATLPDATPLVETTTALAERVADYAVADRASLQQAVIYRQQIGQQLAAIAEWFAPLKARAFEQHRDLCQREREFLKPLQDVDRQIAAAMSAYKAADDARRQQQERDAADARQRDRDAQAATEAAALERQDQPDLAAAVLDEAIAAPRPVVALPDLTKQVDGLRFVRTWHWRYVGGPTDVKRTPPDVRARALRQLPPEFLIADEGKLTRFATTMKDSARVPGIEFYWVDSPRR